MSKRARDPAPEMEDYPNPNDESEEYEEGDQAEEESSLHFKNQEGENYGFTPLEKPEKKEEKEKEKIEETPEMRELKDKIQQLICQYPQLTPRSSNEVMEKLDEMNDKQLRNIYTNCITDVAQYRGTPAANFFIFLLTFLPNRYYLPTYTDVCLKDTELKRDIEAEAIHLLGGLSTRINILFRLLNNAHVAYRELLAEQGFAYGPSILAQEWERKKNEPEVKNGPVITEVINTEKDTEAKITGNKRFPGAFGEEFTS